jgi:hypothetical protein
MSTTSTDDLDSRLDAVAEEAQGKIKAFQQEAEAKRREVEERFQGFLPIAERIVAIAREKLERLRVRLQFDVIPSQVRTDRLYTRSVTLDVKTELASVVRLGLRLSHDSDVRNILLDYNLEIIPVFFRFTPHARMAMPLESFDEAAVGKWLDDRLVDFAHDYLELHTTEQYQERVMVSDTVAGIRFPRFYAAATLEHDGRTYYFISEETRREFAKQHGLTP